MIRCPNCGHEWCPRISDIQAEMLMLARDGLSDKEIGNRLSKSERSINSHFARAIDALGARNRAHAVVMAIRHGVIPLEGT